MKAKRKKAAKSTVSEIKKPEIERCWYCAFNADAGAEAEIRLSKIADDFEYFESDPDEENLIYTQVRVPRCIECKILHEKIDSTVSLGIFCCLIGCCIAGVYFGIYEKSLSRFQFQASVLLFLGAIIGIVWIGVRHDFFMLPKNIKELDDVEKEPQIRALLLKGWRLKS